MSPLQQPSVLDPGRQQVLRRSLYKTDGRSMVVTIIMFRFGSWSRRSAYSLLRLAAVQSDSSTISKSILCILADLTIMSFRSRLSCHGWITFNSGTTSQLICSLPWVNAWAPPSLCLTMSTNSDFHEIDSSRIALHRTDHPNTLLSIPSLPTKFEIQFATFHSILLFLPLLEHAETFS